MVALVEKHASPAIDLRYLSSSQPDLVDGLVGAEWLIATNVTAKTLTHAAELRLIQVPQVGYNGIDRAAARDRGIAVCNISGVNTRAVAEHALALILASMRLLREHDEGTRQGRWPMMEFFGRSLGDFNGSTLWIVGFGNIEQTLASFARPLAGELLYHQRRPVDERVEATLSARYVGPEELMRNSDAVSLHVPLTDSARGMIGARELSWMKPTAVLVNTARGPVVDEQALVAAIASRSLRAAGLSVFSEEPPAADSPLFLLPNVLLLPHMAAGSRAVVEHSFALAFENVARLSNGDELVNRIDDQVPEPMVPARPDDPALK